MLKPTLKFEFRWKHSDDGNEYKLKRAQQGGGVRTKSILREASAENCLKAAQDLFFPAEGNAEGKLEDLDVELADFKDDIIDMSESGFSAAGYKEMYGLHTPRLVILTKKKSEMKVAPPYLEESDDEEFINPPWPTSPVENPVLSPKLPSGDLSKALDNKSVMEMSNETRDYERSYRQQESTDHSFMIGTSEEREELFNQIHRDYEASLAIDKAKDQHLEIEEEATARREELRMTRERLTLPLPDTNDPHIIVSIRHPDLGSVSRPFSPTSKMMDVYNWAGSLASSPEHFFLAQASPRVYIYADEDISSVGSSVLYMIKQDDPVPLSRGHTARVANISSAQQEIIEIEDNSKPQGQPSQPTRDIQITSDLPRQFMEEDTIPTYEEECAIEILKRLEEKRRSIQEELQVHEVTEVSRSNCLKDLLALYRESEVLKKKVPLVFKDEDAAGEGVNRDVYAVFWDNFVTHYCEGKHIET